MMQCDDMSYFDDNDGYSNEFARTSDIYRVFNPLTNDRPKAERLTAEGKFVVMVVFPAFGQFDEILGDEYKIAAVRDTKDEAEQLLARYAEGEDYEIHHYLCELEAPKAVEPEPVEDDDCPF
jgi:hypothetical protein